MNVFNICTGQQYILGFIGLVLFQEVNYVSDGEYYCFDVYDTKSGKCRNEVRVPKQIYEKAIESPFYGEKKAAVVSLSGVFKAVGLLMDFTGAVPETNFSMNASTMSIVECIPLIPEYLKNQWEQVLGPMKVAPAVPEGYYTIDSGEEIAEPEPYENANEKNIPSLQRVVVRIQKP